MDRTNRRSLSPGVVAQKTRFGLRNQQVVYECGRPLPCRGLLDEDSAESCSVVARLSVRYAAGFLDAKRRRSPRTGAPSRYMYSLVEATACPGTTVALGASWISARQLDASQGEPRQRPRDSSEAFCPLRGGTPSRRSPRHRRVCTMWGADRATLSIPFSLALASPLSLALASPPAG